MNKLKPEFRPKLRLPSGFDELLQTIIFVFVVIVLFDMAIPRSLVDGRSMEPTFEDSERLIVSRLDYLLLLPERGDIVVFNSVNPVEFSQGIMLIKRVIGIPGDHIQFINRDLYINGILIDEPYIKEACNTRCPDQEWSLGSDEYFMMGDNRNNSHDSRAFGPVPLDHVVGRVVFRYWTIPRIGFINHRDYEGLDP